MKYKVGDKVRIKGVEWYDENKSKYGNVKCQGGVFFTPNMCPFLCKELTIIYKNDHGYNFTLGGPNFTDDMIEGLASDTPLLPSHIYSPRPNITMQELALIIPHLIAGTVPSEDEGISRHWKILN